MTQPNLQSATKLVDDIVAVSARRFARYGYRKTTVSEIAHDLHISKKTLYDVFPSKRDIMREVAWRELSACLARYGETVRPGSDADAILMGLCRFILSDRAREGRAGLFRGLHLEEEELRAAYRDGLVHVIEAIYTEGRERGVFKPSEPAAAADIVVTMLMTAIGRFHLHDNPVVMFDHVLRMIADAVANRDRIAVDALR